MKMKSKALLAALCAVLLVGATMFGTLAYLTAQTDNVQNVFTVGKLLNDPSKFVLKEHETKDSDNDGIVDDFKDTEVTTQNYDGAIPGFTLPKDPFVRSDEEFAIEAFIFIEVCNNTAVKDKDGNVLYYNVTFEVDDLWEELTDEEDEPILGENGGQIYALKKTAAAGEKLAPQNIIKNQKVTVSENVTEGAELGTLDFYAYACQAAGFDSAAAAWNGAFGTTESEGGADGSAALRG